MTNSPRRRLSWAGLALVLVALVFLCLVATRRDRTLGLGQSVQYDDFRFTVVEANRLGQGPSPDLADDRDDYLVGLRIDNRAKRVPFQFRGDRLVLVDVEGKADPIRPSGERTASGEMVALRTVVLQAGESATVDYLYSLPRDRSNLRLRVGIGGPVGDLIEWLVAGRTEFRLP
jgi:hypothetical protein